ncbi:glyoxalase [Kiloniella spongiae]|uniref:Bleomycin resistance protein n=1 Tax=Kiloniella spongiae TaxID=1489064 RepID=A0A0H2MY24_9PROT|nr:VOC family protein [Kiloniella spongiae]KLN61610.1 glyoxalase [Kiloniella spongiae]
MSRPKLVPELLCSDLEVSLDFYVNIIGFRVLYDRPENRFAYLEMGGVEMMLDETPEISSDEGDWWTARATKPYGRGVNFMIEVADVHAIHDRLKRLRWPLFRPMEDQWYRAGESKVGNREFLVQDPDGYLLRFFTSLGDRDVVDSLSES